MLVAALHGSDDIVSTLIERGADVSLTDKNERGILHLATEHGREESVGVSLNICKYYPNIVQITNPLRGHLVIYLERVFLGCYITLYIYYINHFLLRSALDLSELHDEYFDVRLIELLSGISSNLSLLFLLKMLSIWRFDEFRVHYKWG